MYQYSKAKESQGAAGERTVRGVKRQGNLAELMNPKLTYPKRRYIRPWV